MPRHTRHQGQKFPKISTFAKKGLARVNILGKFYRRCYLWNPVWDSVGVKRLTFFETEGNVAVFRPVRQRAPSFCRRHVRPPASVDTLCSREVLRHCSLDGVNDATSLTASRNISAWRRSSYLSARKAALQHLRRKRQEVRAGRVRPARSHSARHERPPPSEEVAPRRRTAAVWRTAHVRRPADGGDARAAARPQPLRQLRPFSLTLL